MSAVQHISNCKISAGGSNVNNNIVNINWVTHYYYQRAIHTTSRHASPSHSESTSFLLLQSERLQRSAKKLSQELKLATIATTEYYDLAKILDEIIEITMPGVFMFAVGHQLDNHRERRIVVEIAYMQGIIDDFSMKRATNSDTTKQSLSLVSPLKTILDLLWNGFWWLLRATYLITTIQRALTDSRDRIHAALFASLFSSLAKRVHCYQIEIHDFFGAQWSLPQDLCLDREIFLSILRFKFMGGPAELVVISERFVVFQQDGRRAVQAPQWKNAIKEGGGLQLSVLLDRRSEYVANNPDAINCPQCKRSDLTVHNSLDDWVNCLRCNLSFNIAHLDLKESGRNSSNYQKTPNSDLQWEELDQTELSAAFYCFSIALTRIRKPEPSPLDNAEPLLAAPGRDSSSNRDKPNVNPGSRMHTSEDTKNVVVEPVPEGVVSRASSRPAMDVSKMVSWVQRQKTKFSKQKQQATNRAGDARATVDPPTVTDRETAGGYSTPSKKPYAFEASKQTLDILSAMVRLVGIPLVKEVIEIGISIITTCENINEVQGKVEELKNRVAGFLIIIAKVAKDPENDPALKTSQDLMEDLEEFKKSLISIKEDLQAIANQNVILTTFLPKTNMDIIDACANRFQDAIDRFQTLHGIDAAQSLNHVQNQLQAHTVVAHKVEAIDTRTTVMSQKVDDLRALLERTQGTDLAITSIEMPPLPAVFVGREAVVDRIAKQLASCQVEKSRICVLGPGGIGKSSVASAVVEHPTIKETFPSENQLWIPCVSLRSPAALLAHLTRRLGTPAQADPLEAIISVLQTDEPYLIHLDNFETPWYPIEGGQAATKKIIQALDRVANVSILVTMRSEFPPLPHWKTERLEILSLDDCRQMYTTIVTGSEISTELDTLLESIGRLPYAVMLLAKQAKYSGSTPSELLQRWKMDGPRLLSDVEDTASGVEASIELSIQSPYVTKCSGALQLLQTLSLLPAGVYRDDLSTWMRSWEVPALSVLRNACLVITREVVTDGQNKMHLYVLPVVQSYFRKGDRIPTSIWVSTYNTCFEFLLRHKCVLDGPNAPGFSSSRQSINNQEVNIQALLTEVVEAFNPSDTGHIPTHSRLPPALLLPSTAHIEALLTFVSYQVHTKPQLDFAECVHSIVCSHSKESICVAFSTYHLAQTNRRLRNISPAADLYQQAQDLFLDFNRPIEACDADFNAIGCLRDLHIGNPSSSFSLPRAVADAKTRWKDFTTDPTVCGLVSYWTGYLHFLDPPYGMGYSKILSGLLRAKTALVSQHRPADAYQCFKTIIRILLKEERVEEARNSVEEAIKLAEVYGLNTSGFSFDLAKCLKVSGTWGSELMTAIVQSVTSARKAGLPYNAALALEELGEVYVREENWAAACLAYEEALKECRKGHGYSMELVAERVRDNLTYVAAKENNPGDDSVSFTPPDRY